ncbi:MAG TPA: sirohydrochlorin cobaltochelatase [Clostridia bacterium]|nr:sirohydrochlorin cobaltochelatase [Clostridia bacterium]
MSNAPSVQPTHPMKPADAAKPVILMVSFGTSYANTREATLGAIEREAAAAFPQFEVRRAFTSQIVLKILAARDGLRIDNVDQAMKRLVADGVREVVVQPTHVLPGFEYEDMVAAVKPYADSFDALKLSRPLLSWAEDYGAVIDALVEEMPQARDPEAFVWMGHGTAHPANASYAALQAVFADRGYENFLIGTVEGNPTVETLLPKVRALGVRKVTLLPLMIVAGDHAQNDMAGDGEDSWKRIFEREGYKVACAFKGLGEYAGIRALFVAHLRDAMQASATPR